MFQARFGRQRRDGFDRRSIKLLSAGWLPHVPLSDGAVLTLMIGCRIDPAHIQRNPYLFAGQWISLPVQRSRLAQNGHSGQTALW